MNQLWHDNLRALVEHPLVRCVSLFLPIVHTWPEVQQNAIRVEVLLRAAEQQLAARHTDAASIEALLSPMRQASKSREFWQHPNKGLALFAAPGLFQIYELPFPVEELVVVGTGAHITPLLPLLNGGTFYLLILGLNGARLLRGSRWEIEEVALQHAPASLNDALKYEEFGKQPQLHQGVPGHGGERGAIFHGQGARSDVMKDEILRYFQQINHSVVAALRDAHEPLLLAGLNYLLPIYREANSYPHLIEEQIVGNPEGATIEELHERSWPVIAPRFQQVLNEAIERYQRLAATKPPQTAESIRTILPAAIAGRVEVLFIATGQHLWGTFDRASGAIQLHETATRGEGDLLALTARATLLSRGSVYAIAPEEMPAPLPVAAILRYGNG